MSGGAYGEINSPAPPRHNLCTCAQKQTHLCKPPLVRVHAYSSFAVYGSFRRAYARRKIFYYILLMSFRPSVSEWRNLFLISYFTDRFLHAPDFVGLSRNDMAWVYFRAEGALILTSTHSGAVHFTPPCDKAILCYGLERYFTKTACRFYFTWRARFPQNSTVCCFALRGERGHQVARAVTEHSVVLALCEKAYFTLPIDFSTSALRAFGRNDKRGAYHKKLFFGGRG